MLTWAKVTISGIALAALGLAVLAGIGGYFVFRHMEKRAADQVEAGRAIDAAKAKFGVRPPLVEITDPRRGDIRINRTAEPATAQVSTVHIVSWQRETGELMRTQAPLWLMRFSTLNLASRLGLAPEKFRLTVNDIERYGPGVVVDYVTPTTRVLIWVE